MITDRRRDLATWKEIAEEIVADGVTCTPQEVHSYFKRRSQGRVPLGFEAEEKKSMSRLQKKHTKKTNKGEKRNIEEMLGKPTDAEKASLPLDQINK